MPTDSKKPTMEEIVSLAKRRGFVFQASEIYGGISGFYDWGPYGVELTRNIKAAWWKAFVYGHRNVVGLDSAIIQNPKLWKASGHVDTFVDPMVDCKNCKHRFRGDHLIEGWIEKVKGEEFIFPEVFKPTVDGINLYLNTFKNEIACPNCGEKKMFTSARTFNMMFKTYVGPVENEDSIAYLRPETAGGIFAQLENIHETTRKQIPFGVAQIGKAFRNEITPGDFVFRLRELEQMELEFLINPKDQDKMYGYWRQFCMDWLLSIGLQEGNLSFYDHTDDERAHYAAASVDIQYAYPFGTKELYGIANRTDYDVKAHLKATGRGITGQDGDTIYYPYVIEPSVGVERLALALIHSAYSEEEVKGETRVVLKFHPDIAPVKVAVLPLSKKEILTSKANEIWEMLSGEYRTEYDETQSIGRRYRRQDEIGTPLCVTIDFDSLEDHSVTIRHRDTMEQERVKIAELPAAIERHLASF